MNPHELANTPAPCSGGAAIENTHTQKPDWLRARLPGGAKYKNVRALVDEHHLHTICQSGNCPNMGECWGNGTATFMILGNICTRSCGFCAVATGRPQPVDPNEAKKVARTIQLMGVKHAVITSVDRDDLKDGGAMAWFNTIMAVKELCPDVTLETLIPDFKGDDALVKMVASARPEVISHNLETVERLTRQVRIQAKYHRSLRILRTLKNEGIRTKTGIMLGLGEKYEEVLQSLRDIRDNDVDVLTLGQYLQPTPRHLRVERFVPPAEFAALRREAYEMGFDYVESGPLVRSSYKSERHITAGVGRKMYEAEKAQVTAK